MPLIKPSGNMYTFVDWLWNPVKGECPYHCSYCYVSRMMERYGKKQKPLRLDEKELRTKLGEGNYIFICSGCDLFHPDVPDIWILKTIEHTRWFPKNNYLLHTKNPQRVNDFSDWLDDTHTLCVTIESDLIPDEISTAPTFGQRIEGLQGFNGQRMITIEPIVEFGNPESFVRIIRSCHPVQVNIGANSGRNHLPEPSREKVEELIGLLAPHTKIHLKKNLRRILPESRHYGTL